MCGGCRRAFVNVCRESPEPKVNQVITRSENVMSRTILGRTMLIPVRGTVADLQQVMTLNETAEFIWTRLDGTRDVARLACELSAVFAVDNEQARADVSDLLATLVQRQFAEERQD